MAPNTVASSTPYVAARAWSGRPPSCRSGDVQAEPLMTGLSSTCGARAPAGKVSVAPDATLWVPLVSSIGPCRAPRSTTPDASISTADVTLMVSGCGNCTAVRWEKVGGAEPLTDATGGGWAKANRSSAGTPLAPTFHQYRDRCA